MEAVAVGIRKAQQKAQNRNLATINAYPPMPHYLGRPVAFGIHRGAPGAEQGNLHAPILARIARPGQGETKKTGAVKAPV